MLVSLPNMVSPQRMHACPHRHGTQGNKARATVCPELSAAHQAVMRQRARVGAVPSSRALCASVNRRGHTVVSYLDYMVLYGGFSTSSKVFSECRMMDLRMCRAALLSGPPVAAVRAGVAKGGC